MRGYEKWDKYEIGKAKFINNTRFHPHRKILEDYVVNNFNSVIEVGSGELIEYQNIAKRKNIRYAVVDVSDTFCKYATQFNIIVHKGAAEYITIDEKYELLYAASIIEHTDNVDSFLRNTAKMSDYFHLVLFKWSYDGDLSPSYNHKSKYWSSSFNINMLMDAIKTYGRITSTMICMPNSVCCDFKDYSKDKVGQHRNGNYLIIQGQWHNDVI